MNFEYVDIILLAMIAGFIFLRLRGILGRKTGHEENLDANFTHEFPSKKTIKDNLDKINFISDFLTFKEYFALNDDINCLVIFLILIK